MHGKSRMSSLKLLQDTRLGQIVHESLTLVFVFPFIRNEPWQLKRSPAIVGMGKRLSKMFKEGDGSLGFVLQ